MNIKFKSEINQNEKIEKIEFKSKVKISKYNNFNVYEFNEPQNNVMNRIEISEEAVNIFAGTTSINLILGQSLNIEYQTGMGQLFLQSYLEFLTIKEKKINFSYTLKQNDQLIGRYNIELNLIND